MVISVLFFLFCCKQKTAYEMRISDWSSDVCSSDLLEDGRFAGTRGTEQGDEFTGFDRETGTAQGMDGVAVAAREVPDFNRRAHGFAPLSCRNNVKITQTGRASGRKRVCQYV